jgi:hypothetical protein
LLRSRHLHPHSARLWWGAAQVLGLMRVLIEGTLEEKLRTYTMLFL